MAIIPGLNPVQNSGALGVDQSIESATANGGEMFKIGRGISAVGEQIGSVMEKRQKAVDIGAKASLRLALQKAEQDHENFKINNQDETTWAADWADRSSGIRDKLPKGISQEGLFEIENELSHYEQLGAKKVEGDVLNQSVKRARISSIGATEAYVAAGDADGAEAQVKEGIGTLWLPEEAPGMIRKLRNEAEANSVERMLQDDPFTVSKALAERSEDGKPARFGDLDPARRGVLARKAETRISEIRSERFNSVMTDTLDGKFMAKDDALAMAQRGEWSYGQAYSYLNQLQAYEKGQKPEHDNGQYNALHLGVNTYDADADETGRAGADMAAEIMSSQLSDQHKSALMGQLNTRKSDARKILGADKELSKHILGIIDERFKQGKFGTFEVAEEDDMGKTVMVRDQAAWERANDRRFQVTQDFEEYLKTSKETDVKKARIALDEISGFRPRADGFRFKSGAGFDRLNKAAPAKAQDDGKTSYNLPEPLSPYASTFIAAAKENGLDPAFLMAISMHETANGQSSAARNKNNLMGVSNSKGPISFEKPEDSIYRMAKVLANPNGPYKNAKTIGEIGSVYAPSNADNDPRDLNKFWAGGVSKNYKALRGAGSPASFVASRGAKAQFPDPARIESIDVAGKSWGEVQDDYWATAKGGAIGDVDGELAGLRQRWVAGLMKGGSQNEKRLPDDDEEANMPPLS